MSSEHTGPNVTTRHDKKNGNNKEKEHSTPETSTATRDKTTPQSTYLAGFSAKQA